MFPQDVLHLLFVLAICGLVLYVLSQLPLDATMQRVIRVVIIALAVLYVIYVAFGMLGGMPAAAPHHLR